MTGPGGGSFAVEAVIGDVPIVAVTDEGLGNTSWVAVLDGEAMIVDPERDPSPYLAVAQRMGAPIVLTADTHLHADFVTGSRELAEHGAAAVAAADGHTVWPHQPLVPGERIAVGGWRLEALATPGHTPEHLAYLLERGGEPAAVFTGGSLLVGAVARTDLIDPGDTEGLTRALWRSINRELLALPDDVLVLPTHGAGSFCSAPGGSRRWSTIGHERRANPLLSLADEDEFVRQVLAGLGTYPPYFLRLREMNRLGPHVFGALPALPRLTAAQVADLRDRGAVIIDVRSVADYASAHITGSLANTLRPQFVSWLGWLVDDPDTPLVFVTDHHTDRRELVRQCLNIGYEHLAGELDGGIAAWHAGGGPTSSHTLLQAAEVDGRAVVDVRQAGEFRDGHVPGATLVELGSLPGAGAMVDGGPLVVMCGHGERAATAASVLERNGRGDVSILDGGPDDWAAATGRPLDS